MKCSNRKRHRAEEVVANLRQAGESPAKGTPIAEAARSLSVSEVTLHHCRAEYGAVDRYTSPEVRRIRDPQHFAHRLARASPGELDVRLMQLVGHLLRLATLVWHDPLKCAGYKNSGLFRRQGERSMTRASARKFTGGSRALLSAATAINSQ